MDIEKFYCPHCKCETPHTVEKLLLNPNRGVRRTFLAVFSLGASEVIPGPNDDQLFFNHYEITSTCLSCMNKQKTRVKENV